MSRIRLYFDEDAMQQALVAALRARRVDVLTASDCGMVSRSDPEHLRYAGGGGRVLYSFNIRDYTRSFSHSSSATPSGNNWADSCTFLYLLNQKPAAGLVSRLEYLSAWGR